MASKQNLFCDFDGCLANSIKAYCDVYKVMHGGNPDWTKVRRYDLKDQCPKVALEDVNKLFSNELFFRNLELMPNALRVISLLINKFNVIICSIGTYKNLSYKSLWIEEHLPFIENSILIRNKSCNMDKSVIDMSGGIIIDDVYDNLASSNADIKILYDNDYLWNYGATSNFKTFDWLDIYEYLKAL